MSAVVGSLIAVAGTLLGSLSTYWFQQRGARRSEATARAERLRQERLIACSEFAAAVADLKRAVIAVWLRRDRRVTEYQTAYAESDRLGAVAQAAKFRMLLVIDDPGLRELADVAIGHVDGLFSAVDTADLKAREAALEAHLSAFVTRAAGLLGPGHADLS
jgi:hypothetical protein